MPVTKSASKALRRDQRRTEINKPIRSRYKAVVKKALQKPSLKNLKEAYSVLDETAKKKTIHKNKAARLKSKLAKLFHQSASSGQKKLKKKAKK